MAELLEVPYFEGPSDAGEMRNYLNILARAINYLLLIVNPNVPVIDVDSSPYNMAITDGVIIVDASAGNVVINLCVASAFLLGLVAIKRLQTDLSGNTITLIPKGGETIDGAASFPTAFAWQPGQSFDLRPTGAPGWNLF